MNKNRIFVCSETKIQFEYYVEYYSVVTKLPMKRKADCFLVGDSELHYVYNVNKIRGLSKIDMRFVGTFYKRADFSEIKQTYDIIKVLHTPMISDEFAKKYMSPEQFEDYVKSR